MTSDRADYGAKAPPFEVQDDGTDLYAVFHGVRIAKRGAKGTPQARTGFRSSPVIVCAMSTASAARLPSSSSTASRACSKLLGRVRRRRHRGGGGAGGEDDPPSRRHSDPRGTARQLFGLRKQYRQVRHVPQACLHLWRQ